jgi:hypothetical protein
MKKGIIDSQWTKEDLRLRKKRETTSGKKKKLSRKEEKEKILGDLS